MTDAPAADAPTPPAPLRVELERSDFAHFNWALALERPILPLLAAIAIAGFDAVSADDLRKVLSKKHKQAKLADYLYPHDDDRDSNVIEVFIGRLRRKLDPEGSLNPIETLRGRGYRLALAVDP